MAPRTLRLATGKQSSKQRYIWPLQAECITLEPPFLLIHGGLGDASVARRSHFESAIREIALKTQKHLRSKRSLDAVNLSLHAVELLENHSLFNAGTGSKLQSDGIARLSASLMDGKSQKLSAVSNIQKIKNPSKLAHLLLNQSDRTLSGIEANRFAFARKFVPESVVTEDKLKEWQNKIRGDSGTVGCVALDNRRQTAACTSTGGKGFEISGRVSDSCTPAGNFANSYGAISCTGVGEDILDVAAASHIGARLEDGHSLRRAVTKTLQPHREDKCFGLIALSSKGEACVHATSGSLSFALVSRDEILVGITAEDWIARTFTSQYR